MQGLSSREAFLVHRRRLPALGRGTARGPYTCSRAAYIWHSGNKERRGQLTCQSACTSIRTCDLGCERHYEIFCWPETGNLHKIYSITSTGWPTRRNPSQARTNGSAYPFRGQWFYPDDFGPSKSHQSLVSPKNHYGNWCSTDPASQIIRVSSY